ncbi:MAG: MFS transporter [Pseudomonadota bacterium]
MTNTRFIAWLIWIVASIFYAYQYILRVMPSIMMNDIMQQFNIDAKIFGQFSGIYYIGYSLMHLPLGIALDRFGPKKVMSLCILMTVLGMLPIIFSDYWIYPIIGRALIGMGSSAAILGLFKIIRMSFSEQYFPRMLSFSVTIGLIGAIYGGGPVDYMSNKFGYKFVIEIFAIIGIILAALTYIIIPNIKRAPSGTALGDIKLVLRNKKILWTCIFAGFMVGPLEGFADVWGSTFLKQVYGLEKSLASSLPSMIFIGMCFGAPLLTYIGEKTNYLRAIIGAGVVMTICFIAILSSHLSNNLIMISFVLTGICSAYQILAIYKASTYISESHAGITTALANMIIMSFGYAFHSIIGYIVNITGGANDANALIYGITIIPIALIFGSLGFLFISYKKKNF